MRHDPRLAASPPTPCIMKMEGPGNAISRIDASRGANMKPMRFERLEEILGDQYFDLDRAWGAVLPNGAHMFRFPKPGYSPKRLG